MTGDDKIRFHSQIKHLRLPNRNQLKRFLDSIFRLEGKKLKSLNYIFCSDKELLKINIDFLNHNYFTDIITFDLSEKDGIVGEIYISMERVRENAQELKVPVIEELHRVIFHGALHLCGFRDKTKADKLEMTRKEDEYLYRYFK